MIREKAVAIGYDSEKDNAPRILGKGRGEVAKKIKEVGEENNIPIYQDQYLVNQVERIELGEEIPFELYEVMAQVLVFVYDMKEKSKGK